MKPPAPAEVYEAARYFGAECEANPGSSLMADYAGDIAIYYGRDSWAAMSSAEKTEALDALPSWERGREGS